MHGFESYRVKYKDKFGNPITSEEWGDLISDPGDYKIIKRTHLDHCWVSTVWLGLEHLGGHYFETMVFLLDDCYDIEVMRYSSLNEAEKGHDEMVFKYIDYSPDKDI